MSTFFPDKGVFETEASIETDSSLSEIASSINSYFNEFLLTHGNFFIEKPSILKENSEIQPSFENHDSPSEIKSSSKEPLGIKENSLLCKMKLEISHLRFNKRLFFDCAPNSFEKGVTFKMKPQLNFVTLSPPSKYSTSSLKSLSFDKFTFALATSTLVSRALSHYYLRPTRRARQALFLKRYFLLTRKISLRFDTLRFETSSSNSSSKSGLNQIAS